MCWIDAGDRVDDERHERVAIKVLEMLGGSCLSHDTRAAMAVEISSFENVPMCCSRATDRITTITTTTAFSVAFMAILVDYHATRMR